MGPAGETHQRCHLAVSALLAAVTAPAGANQQPSIVTTRAEKEREERGVIFECVNSSNMPAQLISIRVLLKMTSTPTTLS